MGGGRGRGRGGSEGFGLIRREGRKTRAKDF